MSEKRPRVKNGKGSAHRSMNKKFTDNFDKIENWKFGKSKRNCANCMHGNHGLSNFSDKVLCVVGGMGKGIHRKKDHICGEHRYDCSQDTI